MRDPGKFCFVNSAGQRTSVSMRAVFLFILLSLFSASYALSNGTVCNACIGVTTAAEYLEEYEQYNSTTLLNYLMAACKYLPNQQAQLACDGIVLIYGPKIVEEIIAGAGAQKICTDINLCSAPTAASLVECTRCVNYVQVSKSAEKFHKSSVQHEALLSELCEENESVKGCTQKVRSLRSLSSHSSLFACKAARLC
ncbi:hypothetical protein PROFUN_13088 [Planoprotostelium fungivorum]|uniref:Saposin B-type domain-containing protein n=1 Tax=Planoprotostelium fungivorum TaxID=1890364 RepID=A0A2P6N5J8_9EUKA|nr:hypothetical protein PROFUN_13088 [Planoprotostelium fungivorum]